MSSDTPDVTIEREVVETSAIQAIEAAQVDQQIATAKRYPRDVTTFLERAKTMIGEDKVLAGLMGYEVERGGKFLTGPSVRLAEVALLAYGNARVQVVEEPIRPGARSLVVYGMAHDLENNVAVRIPKARRITTREGKQFGDDMLTTTLNAAVAVAYRDAVLKIIPGHFVKALYRHAMGVAAGDVKDMPTARRELLEAFKAVGVPQERLLGALGIEGPEGITLEHIGALRGLYARVKSGEVKAADVFKPKDQPAAGDVEKAKGAKERMTGNGGGGPPTGTPPVGDPAATTAAGAPSATDEKPTRRRRAAAQEEKPVKDTGTPPQKSAGGGDWGLGGLGGNL